MSLLFSTATKDNIGIAVSSFSKSSTSLAITGPFSLPNAWLWIFSISLRSDSVDFLIFNGNSFFGVANAANNRLPKDAEQSAATFGGPS